MGVVSVNVGLPREIAWRGKPVAGPALAPQPPEQVRREPAQRPAESELPPKESSDA